jgi:phosphoribosylformylglycinamidine cyclo-ligase
VSRYVKAGVDIDGAASSVKRIMEIARETHNPSVLTEIGGFSGLFRAGDLGMKDMVLAAGADGVGTKVKIAQAMGKHDTVGIDLVAMNADDVVTSGAKPLFFLDYVAVGKLRPVVVEEIVRGVAEGCKRAGCALLGGETAQMPGMYDEDEYDLAGFCVGAVERDHIIDGSRIAPGDVLVGLESSGLHSNGFTLARRVLLDDARLGLERRVPELDRTLGEELLEPTRIYAPAVLRLRESVDLKGVAHITGGGIPGNVPRILPRGTRMRVTGKWPVPPVFELLRRLGGISDEEMSRVFNMGIGMVVVVPESEADKAASVLERMGIGAHYIGTVEKDE